VVGGLITSTLLSLLFVPAVYTYVDDLEDLLARVFQRSAVPAGQAACIATGNKSD
jgi:hypothetical protein